MKNIAILIIVMTMAITLASIFTGCTNAQNTTASSTPGSSATVSANTSESSSATTIASTASTSSTLSTTSTASPTNTTSGSTSTVGTTTKLPVSINDLAKTWDASIGQYEKAYNYSMQTGANKRTDYSIKILSIKTVSTKDIKMLITAGKSGIASVLDFEFLDEDGNKFEERPNSHASLGATESSIVFSTESGSNLANHTKFIVMGGLDADKNNGIRSVIFECAK